jgi:hypothetical protein
MKVRKLYTFYNPTIKGMANSHHAELLFISTENKVKKPESFSEAWFQNDQKEKWLEKCN